MVRPGASCVPGSPVSVRVSGIVAFVLLVPGVPGDVLSRLVTVALRLAVPGDVPLAGLTEGAVLALPLARSPRPPAPSPS